MDICKCGHSSDDHRYIDAWLCMHEKCNLCPCDMCSMDGRHLVEKKPSLWKRLFRI